MTAIRPRRSSRPRALGRGPTRALRRILPAVTIASAGLFGGWLYRAHAEPAPGPVAVFPIPGARVAAPQTLITLRGLPDGRAGTISVTGSVSGRHTGRFEVDSDRRGGSFVPAKPFAPGELVTVTTRLKIRGARHGSWRFTVADPPGPVPSAALPMAARMPGDVLGFHSRPDLTPAAIEILKESPPSDTGDIFLTPQQGPLQNGPMILAPDGTLVWFHPVKPGDMAADFQVQAYRDKPVITWWQGYSGAGLGYGEDVIDDSSYRRLAIVHGANGLSADLHEFQLTSRGTALITAYYPVYWNASGVGGAKRQIVLDSVVQEIDIKTGLPLFQWDSLDHVPLSDSYEPVPKSAGQPFDYFHVNSVQQDGNNLLISARNTCAAYEVSPTGGVLWTVGGKRSSFTLAPAARFAFQHDVRAADGDRTVTLFDDGAGPPKVHTQSRGLTLQLDFARRTATMVHQDDHAPALLADYEGNFQPRAAGDHVIGWGQQPYVTEYDAGGQVIFDARFIDQNSSYRAYRFDWTATPSTQPAVAASTTAGTTTVYASWNGATTVASWHVLAGSSRGSLRYAGSAPSAGFETQVPVAAAPYVAVQALDSSGRVLSTSATVAPTGGTSR
jgi:hypothetical protein